MADDVDGLPGGVQRDLNISLPQQLWVGSQVKDEFVLEMLGEMDLTSLQEVVDRNGALRAGFYRRADGFVQPTPKR